MAGAADMISVVTGSAPQEPETRPPAHRASNNVLLSVTGIVRVQNTSAGAELSWSGNRCPLYDLLTGCQKHLGELRRRQGLAPCLTSTQVADLGTASRDDGSNDGEPTVGRGSFIAPSGAKSTSSRIRFRGRVDVGFLVILHQLWYILSNSDPRPYPKPCQYHLAVTIGSYSPRTKSHAESRTT